jgi:predicted ATPase
MIGQLRIENFKCFSSATFTMRPLTVLTGVNGGGKSTVIQSLLLARAAAEAPGTTVQLNLPPGLALGEARDVLHWQASEPGLEFELFPSNSDVSWKCHFRLPDDERALRLHVRKSGSPVSLGVDQPTPGFTYLCAERLGPRDTLELSTDEPNDIGVGVQGEFTAQVLALRETQSVRSRREVRAALQHPSLDSPLPRLQSEAWASDIIRPVRITAQLAGGILVSTVRFTEPGQGSEQVRPANTGFGVSYALPIIVAGLLTKPGDLLIVENPEAHLHPAGQSKLGRFLARVAGSGVQVIMETHSDHVLNGARLAVAHDRALAAQDMITHYFDHDRVLPIDINESGELSHWPEGFFDQIENDLGRLVRARRAK